MWYPSSNCPATTSNAPSIPIENSIGINGSRCSPPAAWLTTCRSPFSSNLVNDESPAYDKRTKGSNLRASGILHNLVSMAARNTRSYARMPSTLRMVSPWSASVEARTTFPTQSVPARVDNANWKGAHSCSKSFMNCLASVLATNRPSVHPVAMPLTVNRADINVAEISRGKVACAKLVHASNTCSVVTTSSKRILKCLYVHLPGLGDDPPGALFKLSKNFCRFNFTGDSGVQFRTSSGNGRTTSWERWFCISSRVSWVLGAKLAPVRHSPVVRKGGAREM